MHLLTGTGPTLRLAQFIQAQEAAVGINVVIDTVDNATAPRGRRAGTSTPPEPHGTGRPTPTATSIIRRDLGSSNCGGYSNPRLDLILANG